MSTTIEGLFAQASALWDEERAAPAGLLLDSLDHEADEDVEEAWAREIERRMADNRAGRVKTVGWTELRARLHRRTG